MPLPPPTPPPMPPSVEEELLSTLHASPPLDAYDYSASNDYEPFRAEDAAQMVEDSYLGRNQKRKDLLKRVADGAVSDESSDLEVPASSRSKPAAKKRKVDKDSASIADEFERSVGGLSPSKFASSKAKGKGKQSQLREQSLDSVVPSATPKGRKRAGARKLLPPDTLEGLGMGSAAGSVAGDVTPSASRPVSPALTATSVVYELDEVVPPLRRAKKVDENAMAKRLKSLEEAQKKVWTNIARRDVAKVWVDTDPLRDALGSNLIVQVYKYAAMGHHARQSQLKRLATLSSMQARRPFTRTAKAQKDIQAKGKRLMREMLVFWKKNEREERDVRKREQKEAVDRAKIEEEKREAARQARKLEFLISQTELYSHFVGNKLKSESQC
jgi:DNA helicase INO80